MEERITCSEVEELLPRYMDGDLATRMAGTVKVHLSECSGCASSLETLTFLEASLASLSDDMPDPSIVSGAVISRLGLTTGKRRHEFWSGLPAFTSAAMLVLSAIMFFLRRYVVDIYNHAEDAVITADTPLLDSVLSRISTFFSSLGVAYSGFTGSIVEFLEGTAGWYAGIDEWVLISVYAGTILLSLLFFARIVMRVMRD